MTKFLASALDIDHHSWHNLRQNLESANGHPVHDIRLSSEINGATRYKLKELGLDPEDTTSEELYHVLQSQFIKDDQLLTRQLQTLAVNKVSLEGQATDGLVEALKKLPDSKRCYAIKLSALKNLIKLQPPKKTMKRLGYRTQASMFKHQSALDLITAAWLIEDKSWKNKLVERYKKLSAIDFEDRGITIQSINPKSWTRINQAVPEHKNNVLVFKELGSVIILPLPQSAPRGSVTASTIVALEALNEIRVFSSFLKLSQVRPNFGELVKNAVQHGPTVNADLSGISMPWHIVQRYYANFEHYFNENVFEPYLQIEDLVWHPIEESLCAIESGLKFWRNTSTIASQHHSKPISFNIHDVALNVCNKNPFQDRNTESFKKSLWQELLLRYFNHEHLEESISAHLQPELVQLREDQK